MLYFRHDRLIDDEIINKTLALIYVAQRLDIDLRSKMLVSDEGFRIERFFVQVPSDEASLKLREDTKRMHFESWEECSEAEFVELIQYHGYELPSLKDIPEYFVAKGYQLSMRLNRHLKERWAEATPTYLEYEWTPFTPVSLELVSNVLEVSDFCLGCSTRLGLVHQGASEFYSQSILVRTLMDWEVGEYKRRINELIQVEAWAVVSKQAYETATQITDDLLTSAFENINRLAQMNSDLQSE